MGTVDPGAPTSDENGVCRTNSTEVRKTGLGAACVSAWGAEDMIGNLWEWTADWYAGVGDGATPEGTWTRDPFKGDGTWNIASKGHDGTAWQAGLPVAALRGGSWYFGSRSGRFALSLFNTPSDRGSAIGFRCVLPH